MDAVNLALPTNTLANATLAAAADKGALPIDDKGEAIDFATLLAVGLNMQEQLPGQSPVMAELAGENISEHEEILDPSASIPDPGQLLATDPQLPAAPTIVERINQTVQHAGGDASGIGTLPEADAGLPHAAKAARFADDAAGFAATDKAATQASAQFQAELAQQTQLSGIADAQRISAAAEAAAHALNLQSVEQRPAVHQPTAVLEVAAPVSSPGFADALSQQVVWMVDKDAQIAELRINPPELGPVEVRLSVNGDQASAQFVSTHQEVREALETAIERLRESFAAAGIELGQASVSAESFREQTAGHTDARSAAHAGYGTSTDTNTAGTSAAAQVQVRRGLVDIYA